MSDQPAAVVKAAATEQVATAAALLGLEIGEDRLAILAESLQRRWAQRWPSRGSTSSKSRR